MALQMSGCPQMSELPKEERVGYAYQKDIKLKRNISNGTTHQFNIPTQMVDDELFLNTPQ